MVKFIDKTIQYKILDTWHKKIDLCSFSVCVHGVVFLGFFGVLFFLWFLLCFVF